MTASFSTLAWPPFRVYWARLQVREAPVSTFPRIKAAGLLKGPKSTSWSHENCLC